MPLLPHEGDVGPDFPDLPSEGDVGPDLPDLPSDGDVGPDLPDLPSDGEVGPDLPLFPSEGEVGPDLPDLPPAISGLSHTSAIAIHSTKTSAGPGHEPPFLPLLQPPLPDFNARWLIPIVMVVID